MDQLQSVYAPSHWYACLVFLSSVVMLRGTSHQCQEIFIGGSHVQPHVVGYYVLQKYTHNNRLVYRHTCAQYVLYCEHSPGGNIQWVVGPQEGSAIQHVISHTYSHYPCDVTSWKSWHEANKTFVMDHRIFYSCADSVGECRSFVIRGPDVPDKYKGPYHSHGITNNHTSYKHGHDDMYVFHYNESGCTRWIVGSQLGDNVVSMQALTDSRTPTGITDQWAIFHSHDNIQRTYSIRVECLDKSDRQLCGVRVKNQFVSPLLLGGSDAYPGKWPYTISYSRKDGVHKCGGAVVGRKWVVTAGHCVSGADTTNETIELGGFNLDTEEDYRQSLRIKSVHSHPNFVWVQRPFRLNNDVALIELEADITFNDYIQPVCVPPQREEFPFSSTFPSSRQSNDQNYTRCHLTGWGMTNRGSGVGGTLQEVRVGRLFNMRDCYETYFADLESGMKKSKGVCLFGDHAARMCKGDSGSPFFCERAGVWTLLGLGGWTLSDCAIYFFNYPSVYTDVTVFSDWMTAVMYGQ